MPGSVRRATDGVQGHQDLFGCHLTRPADRSTPARTPGAENILPLIPGHRSRLGWFGIYRVSGRNGQPCLGRRNLVELPRLSALDLSIQSGSEDHRSPGARQPAAKLRDQGLSNASGCTPGDCPLHGPDRACHRST